MNAFPIIKTLETRSIPLEILFVLISFALLYIGVSRVIDSLKGYGLEVTNKAGFRPFLVFSKNPSRDPKKRPGQATFVQRLILFAEGLIIAIFAVFLLLSSLIRP